MRNTKHILTIFIFWLFITALHFGYTDITASSTESNSKNVIIVYYFHKTVRCPSCMTIERVTRESVESAFENEIKNGRIKMISVDIDKKGNEHFLNDYKLEFQSVVISDIKAGQEQRCKKLDRVWELLYNEWDLRKYIQREIRTYLQ